MELILKLIYSIAITILFINAEPMILLKNKLGFKEDGIYDPLKNFINGLIWCALCSGFWIGILITCMSLNMFIHVIGLASIASILSEIVNRKLNE